MCAAVLIGWDPATPPTSPRIWAQIQGRFWSAKIDDISLWPPGGDMRTGKASQGSSNKSSPGSSCCIFPTARRQLRRIEAFPRPATKTIKLWNNIKNFYRIDVTCLIFDKLPNLENSCFGMVPYLTRSNYSSIWTIQWDQAEWLERLTANAEVAAILGSIPSTQWNLRGGKWNRVGKAVLWNRNRNRNRRNRNFLTLGTRTGTGTVTC